MQWALGFDRHDAFSETEPLLFADFRVLGMFGICLRRQVKRTLERPALQGGFRFVELRRQVDRLRQGRGSLKGARSPAKNFIPVSAIRPSMREADAFQRTAFVGLARTSKRDPYRLSLFAQHLRAEERPLVLLPIQGGTLLVTDLRLLEMRAHLEVHGAWNVKQFQGYAIHHEIERRVVRDIGHSIRPAPDAIGSRRVEEVLVLTTTDGDQEIRVSRGPQATMSEEDVRSLRAAVLSH